MVIYTFTTYMESASKIYRVFGSSFGSEIYRVFGPPAMLQGFGQFDSLKAKGKKFWRYASSETVQLPHLKSSGSVLWISQNLIDT